MKKILFLILFLTGCSTSQNLVENYHQEYKLYIDEDNEFQEYVNDEIRNMPYKYRTRTINDDTIVDMFRDMNDKKEQLNGECNNSYYGITYEKRFYKAVVYLNEQTPKVFEGYTDHLEFHNKKIYDDIINLAEKAGNTWGDFGKIGREYARKYKKLYDENRKKACGNYSK